jgi:adenylate kinase
MTIRSFNVVYLTGPPASGKSTVTKLLRQRIAQLDTWDYGERLRSHVERRAGASVTYDQVRGESARIITAADVAETDENLLQWVEENRAKTHLLVDSHAVTKESFGYRATAFTEQHLKRLNPTLLICLYVPPTVAVERISANAEGRRPVTEFEAGFHAGLQGAVAITYGITTGRPVYFIDGSVAVDMVVEEIKRRIEA